MAPAIIGYAFGGFSEGLRCLLWAGFARVAILHQLTWSVNSIGHMYGSKAPNSADESRDNLVLALLLFGEGLHNSHHINPTAAVNGSLWLDWNGALLVGLEKLGVVTSLRKRSSSQRPID